MESHTHGTEATAATGSIAGTNEPDNIEREVRFAVVIYGGVSLAIYINGIVQELLNMVLSTGRPSAQLTQLQQVYRDLACRVGEPKDAEKIRKLTGLDRSVRAARPGRAALRDAAPATATEPEHKTVHTKFVVDILSGTSAGGINAIYLAKALANDLSIQSLAEMWITDADLNKLLNDKDVDPSWIRQASPPSLLNSRWMYLRLLTALDKMNPPQGKECGSLVDDLDLFCTTTDLRGLVVDVALTDESINEQRYRNVYHFRRRPLLSENNEKASPFIGPVHDFAPEMDPFLAFAARCTSSFPVAFEPMQLGDIPTIVNSDAKFRSRYLTPKQEAGKKPEEAGNTPGPQTPNYAPALFGDEVAEMIGAKRFADICSIYRTTDSDPRGGFAKRSFGDGGYLDNKPFTYAIETMKKRHADLPVDRKLIYIEPSPETLSKTPPPSAPGDNRPTVIENSLDALVVLPRYETIRQDIESVIRWNADIARLQRVLTYIEDRVERQLGMAYAGQPYEPLDDETYLRLRLSGATDQIANRMAEAMGVDPSSASGQALRSVTGTWRDLGFGELSEEPLNVPSLARFLDLFDFDHCERLIRFLRERMQRAEVPREQRKLDMRELARITADFAALSEPPLVLDLVNWEGHAGALASWEQYLDFITDPSFAAACLAKLDREPVHVARMLAADDDGRDQRVKWLFEHQDSKKILSLLPRDGPPEPFQNIADEVARQVIAVYGDRVHFERGAKPPLAPGDGATSLQKILGELEKFFTHPKYGSREMFDRRDVEAYPIVFGTDLGEFEPIDIFRISPNESTPIAGTSPPGCAGNPPLRGESLDAFGAFLDFQWRFSDMLRGRLDGAERLITAVLPDSDEETRKARENFIRRAQEQIALEWTAFQDDLQQKFPELKPSEQKLKLINELKMYVSTENLCEEAKKAAGAPDGCPPPPPVFLKKQLAQNSAQAKEKR
jgi:patatin-related protein